MVRRAHTDRLQAAIGADRVGQLLEFAIVDDVSAWVERVRTDYPVVDEATS